MTDDATSDAPRSLDARYDQPRLTCACGSAWFLSLTPCEVHAERAGSHRVTLLPPYEASGSDAQRRAVERLALVECVACRTRYDRVWREVV